MPNHNYVSDAIRAWAWNDRVGRLNYRLKCLHETLEHLNEHNGSKSLRGQLVDNFDDIAKTEIDIKVAELEKKRAYSHLVSYLDEFHKWRINYRKQALNDFFIRQGRGRVSHYAKALGWSSNTVLKYGRVLEETGVLRVAWFSRGHYTCYVLCSPEDSDKQIRGTALYGVGFVLDWRTIIPGEV